MKTWTDEELIAILRESKEWKDCVDSCRQRWGAPLKSVEEGVRLHVLQANRLLDEFDPVYQPLLKALRALADEVKCGAILGSEERCAICGTHDDWIVRCPTGHENLRYFLHDRCYRISRAAFNWLYSAEVTLQRIAMTILQARKIHSEVGWKDCGKCMRSPLQGGGCLLSNSTRECDYWPRESKVVTCGICGGGSVDPDPKRDVYHCRHCNAEALGTSVRYQPDKVKWIRYPRKADEPTASSKVHAPPAEPKAPLAPEDIRYPVECKTPAEKFDWLRHTYGGSSSVLCWKCRKPHDPNDGSWISAGTDLRPLDAGCRSNFDVWFVAQTLLGTERELEREVEEREAFDRWAEKQRRRTRGPDPKIVLVGLDDVFDPRRRR